MYINPENARSVRLDRSPGQHMIVSNFSQAGHRPGWRVYENSKPEYRSGYYGGNDRSVTPEQKYREYEDEIHGRLGGRDPRFMSRKDLEEYLRVREILKEKRMREKKEKELRDKPFVI